jgi:hypothetical protein
MNAMREAERSYITIIASNSLRSSESDSADSACTGIGSLTLTLVRLFCGEDSTRAAGVGLDGSQPSNIFERRVCENVPLQSPDFGGELAGDWFAAALAFAVPSPSTDSSSSSSDSCKSAKRLSVASEGVKELEDNVRVLLLLYHSSGTQNR